MGLNPDSGFDSQLGLGFSAWSFEGKARKSPRGELTICSGCIWPSPSDTGMVAGIGNTAMDDG